MTLGELIAELGKHDREKKVEIGFGRPHSYRGFYECLAFEPTKNTTVGEMLEAAKGALNKTFTGYKGGDFTMSEWTDVWLANYSECGEGIGPVLLSYMLKG